MKRIGDLVARLPKFEPCVNCDYTGWVKHYDVYREREGMKRCACYLAWQEKIAREVSAVSDTGKKRKI
jgi:hypothetical protein